MEETTKLFQDDDLLRIQNEKDSALTFRERRHGDWNDNYILWRNKVITNRLTQRQTVNIPLTKYVLATIMKDVDEEMLLYFESLDNDQQKEIFYNEFWNKTAKLNQDYVKSLVHRRQALLYGRSFRKLNIKDGKFFYEVIDPQNILVDRHVDPASLDSSRILIQTGIYRTLDDILANESFLSEGKEILSKYYSELDTTQIDETNYSDYTDKNERMESMGLTDAISPAMGTTYVELNEVYREEDNQITFYTVACTEGGMIKLAKKPLHEVLGKTKDDFWKENFPYTSLATEHERTDFWNDGPADIVRSTNMVVNTWISQEVENRTLKNLNMHYYDSSNKDFIPQTFSPEAWGWYPVPGKPSDVIQEAIVSDLSSSLEEIQFVIGIAEKAVASTSANAGATEQQKVTLGEVQLAITNAQERTKSFNSLIEEEMYDFGVKYTKMIEAQSDNLQPLEISKKGREGRKLYTKTISPEMLTTRKGWEIKVRTKNNKMAEDAEAVQKLQAVVQIMPSNAPLLEIQKKKLLEFAGLSAQEMKDVLDAERQGATVPEIGMADPNAPQDGTMPMDNQPAGVPAMPEVQGIPAL